MNAPSFPASARGPANHPRGRWLTGLLLVTGTLILSLTVRATTVTAPTFAELVDESQLIVRARIQDVRAAWVDSPQGRVIKTFVTLSVLKPLKGQAPAELTLQLLGGEIDGHGMQVAGMPRFQPGRIEFLFISGNGVRFCPLVGMMHGRYQVLAEPATGREYVARNDGVPLASEHDVQLPQSGPALALPSRRPATALTPLAFEQAITGELLRHAARP